MNRLQRHDDEDDAFDERGLLKDGRRMRVPMMARDSMSPVQREIAADTMATGRNKLLTFDNLPMVVDAWGDGGLALSRPGARYAADHAMRVRQAQLIEDAYRLHAAEESRRWQGSSPDEIEVKPVTGDARRDAYLAREEYDRNAWRGPRDSGKW